MPPCAMPNFASNGSFVSRTSDTIGALRKLLDQKNDTIECCDYGRKRLASEFDIITPNYADSDNLAGETSRNCSNFLCSGSDTPLLVDECDYISLNLGKKAKFSCLATETEQIKSSSSNSVFQLARSAEEPELEQKWDILRNLLPGGLMVQHKEDLIYEVIDYVQFLEKEIADQALVGEATEYTINHGTAAPAAINLEELEKSKLEQKTQ